MKLTQKLKLFFLNTLIRFYLLKDNVYVKKITDKKELDMVRNFAWKVYAIEKKYIDPNFFPHKMFTDEFDKYSIYFSAWKKGEIIGIVRLVLNSPLKFPIEKVYRLQPIKINKKNIAEISRLIVKNGPWKKNIVMLALCKQCFEESLSRGINYWYAFLPQELKNHFEKKYNIQFIELKYLPPTGEEKSYRKPYRFYFSKFKPHPYLLPLEKILENFKIW